MVSGVGWPQYNSSCRTLSTSSSPMSGPGGKGDSNIQGSVRTIGGDGSPPGQPPAILHGPRSRRRPSYHDHLRSRQVRDGAKDVRRVLPSPPQRHLRKGALQPPQPTDRRDSRAVYNRSVRTHRVMQLPEDSGTNYNATG